MNSPDDFRAYITINGRSYSLPYKFVMGIDLLELDLPMRYCLPPHNAKDCHPKPNLRMSQQIIHPFGSADMEAIRDVANANDGIYHSISIVALSDGRRFRVNEEIILTEYSDFAIY